MKKTNIRYPYRINLEKAKTREKMKCQKINFLLFKEKFYFLILKDQFSYKRSLKL